MEPTAIPRTLGRWDLVLLKVVAIVNINNVPAVAVYGWASMFLWALAFAAFFVPEAVAVLALSRRHPGEGGIYLWTRKEFGEAHGFLSGWCYWTNNLFYVPVLLVYMAGILAFAGGEARASALVNQKLFVALVAFGWLTLIAVANIRGLAVGKWIQNIGGLSAFLSVALVLAAAVAVRTSGSGFQAPAVTGMSWEMATSFAVMCNALVGIELASTMGDEIRNPVRDLGPAIAVAGVVSIASYLLVTGAVLTLVPVDQLGVIQGIMQAVGAGARAANVGWIVVPLAIVMALATGGAASAWFAGSSRIPFVAGLTSALPPGLGKLHPRWHSPHIALTTCALLAALFTSLSLVGSTVAEAYQVLLKAAVVIQLIPFMYLFLALTKTSGVSVAARFAGVVGLVTTAIGLCASFLPTADVTSVLMFELKMVVGVVGPTAVGWFLFRRAQRTAVVPLVMVGLLLAVLRPAAQTQTTVPPADLIIVNGKVYGAGGVFHEAIAIRGNSIVQVGRAQDVERLRGPRTEVIDARGRAVVPGFNDSHVHFLSGGLALRDVDLAGITSLREVQDKIRVFAQAGGDRQWIRGRGWLYGAFPGGLPTREQLDEVVPDRPAIMICYDGHTTWVNSRALQLAGITRDTPDPANGVIVKDPKTGEPTGVLKEAAQSLLNRVVPRPTEDDQRAALRAAVAEAHRLGVTSIQNASGNADEFKRYADAQRAGDLRLRTYSALSISPGFSEADADRFEAIRTLYGDDPVFRTGIVKIVADGVIESRTAGMLAPYAGVATAGAPNYSAAELDRIVAMMDKRGWQIEVHAIGDRTVRMTLDAFERAIAANPRPARGRRHRIEHIETIDPADIPRFGVLGVIASQQPMHVVLGDMNSLKPSGPWPDNLGPERASRAWTWKSIRDTGGQLTFGSDWAVAPLDPLRGIWVVTTRVTPTGMRDQKLTIAQAIDGYTAWPAYASFDDHRKGTLAAGMMADVVVLSRDIFAQPPLKADDVVVDATIFDGKVVFRR